MHNSELLHKHGFGFYNFWRLQNVSIWLESPLLKKSQIKCRSWFIARNCFEKTVLTSSSCGDFKTRRFHLKAHYWKNLKSNFDLGSIASNYFKNMVSASTSHEEFKSSRFGLKARYSQNLKSNVDLRCTVLASSSCQAFKTRRFCLKAHYWQNLK